MIVSSHLKIMVDMMTVLFDGHKPMQKYYGKSFSMSIPEKYSLFYSHLKLINLTLLQMSVEMYRIFRLYYKIIMSSRRWPSLES